jgi:hypothetical protein
MQGVLGLFVISCAQGSCSRERMMLASSGYLDAGNGGSGVPANVEMRGSRLWI